MIKNLSLGCITKQVFSELTVAPVGQVLPDFLQAQREVPWASRTPPAMVTPLTWWKEIQLSEFPMTR